MCFSQEKSMHLHFHKVPVDHFVMEKSFWNFIKSFMKGKSCHLENYIMLIQNNDGSKTYCKDL